MLSSDIAKALGDQNTFAPLKFIQRFRRLKIVSDSRFQGQTPCFCRYVFSSDVAKALVDTHAIAPLKFMPNEDATFGFWVMGMNLRRVDHPRAKTPAGHCCWG